MVDDDRILVILLDGDVIEVGAAPFVLDEAVEAATAAAEASRSLRDEPT